MSLRRTILDLHRQSHKLSLSNPLFSMNNISASSAARFQIGRDISSIPFALTQKLKPDFTDRSISSLGRSDLENAAKFSRLLQCSSRGYSTGSILPKLHVLYHAGEGMEEILADYVHQEMTRNLMVISLGLFQFIVLKDVFVFLFF
ncbi:hypothetical protein AALP_AA4G254000 [Arabis alpina]|uniref:Uncharacterized protein n=1 Tax=Arabis alpina TaxID=50452 RepID=A0A087H5L3_ARAAL|nr:hypothetical protein AALP_AA4G254000 [Arabis alpina]